jgi:hypothetical protein
MRDKLKEDFLRDAWIEAENVALLIADKRVAALEVVSVTGTDNLFVLNPALELTFFVFRHALRDLHVGVFRIADDLCDFVDVFLELADLVDGVIDHFPFQLLRVGVELLFDQPL